MALAVAGAAAIPSGHAPPSDAREFDWKEIGWTPSLDNWGMGRAWQGTLPDGGEVTLLARTKTGFCNCFTGVIDDVEIDRIGDVDLHGDTFTPEAAGQSVSIGALPGRARTFQAVTRFGGTRHVLSIVAAADCKAVVATIVARSPISPAAESAALRLLDGTSFRQWAANQP